MGTPVADAAERAGFPLLTVPQNRRRAVFQSFAAGSTARAAPCLPGRYFPGAARELAFFVFYCLNSQKLVLFMWYSLSELRVRYISAGAIESTASGFRTDRISGYGVIAWN